MPTDFENEYPGKKIEKDLELNSILVEEDFLFPFNETFENGKFNLMRLRPLDFSDLREESKDLNKTPFKQLTKQEKKTYFEKQRELKTSIRQKKEELINTYKGLGPKHKLFKITSSAVNVINEIKPFNFSDYEIEMAKKCLLNMWNFPPPEYFHDSFKQIEYGKLKQGEDEAKKIQEYKNKGNNFFIWSAELYQDIVKDFKMFEQEALEPTKQKGKWIDSSEIGSYFDTLIILVNPLMFDTSEELESLWTDYKEKDYTYKDNTMYRIYSDYNEDDIQKENRLNKVSLMKGSLFFSFEFLTEKEVFDYNYVPYIRYSLIQEHDQKEVSEGKLNLHSPNFQFDELNLKYTYYLMFNSIMAPLGFNLTLKSTVHIQPMKKTEFFNQQKQWNSFDFILQHPNLKTNQNYLLGKWNLKLTKHGKLYIDLRYDLAYLAKIFEFAIVRDHFRLDLQANLLTHYKVPAEGEYQVIF